MKHLHFIALMFLVLVLACNRPVETRHGTSLPSAASPQLQAVDSLMWTRPDSALAVLLPWFDTCGRDGVHTVSTAYDRHYAQLLLAELLYKNDYPQTNREELLEAVDYFDSLTMVTDTRDADTRGVSLHRAARRDTSKYEVFDGVNVSATDAQTLAFLDARAHYINGVGYYERDSVVEACKEYLTALEMMEERFKEKELVGKKAQFISLSYTRIAVLYSDFYLHEQAIYFAKLSLLFYDRYASSPNHVAWILNEIGSQYDLMEELDSADYYYQKAATIINDSNLLMYRDIVTHLAILQYKKGDFSEEPIHRLQELISKSENDEETLARYSVLGELYYHEKQIDSAWKYLSVVFRKTSNDNSKRQAAALLVNICKTKGNESDTEDYTNFLIPFANQEEGLSDVKSQLTELYKTWCLVKVERQHFIQSKKWSKMAFAGTALLICIVLTTSSLYLRNRKQKHVLETQIETERQHREELEAERQTHRMEQAAMSGRLKRSNQELLELRGQIKQLDELAAKTKAAASFNDEPVCRLILERVKEGQFKSKVNYINYKDFALSKSHLLDLRLAADLHFNQFTRRLKTAYPKITNTDLDYCCLYLLGLTDSDVAALMQRSYNTVIERNGKMRKIFGSTSALPTTLMEIANDSHQFD